VPYAFSLTQSGTRPVSLLVVFEAAGFGDAVHGVDAAGYDEEGDEESDGGYGENRDGKAERGADLRGRAGGGVAAHAAALRVCGGWDEQKDGDAERQPKRDSTLLLFAVLRNSRSLHFASLRSG
jgi:hypothetical protein